MPISNSPTIALHDFFTASSANLSCHNWVYQVNLAVERWVENPLFCTSFLIRSLSALELEDFYRTIAAECGVMLIEHHVSGKMAFPKLRLVVDTEDGITIKEITEVTKRVKSSVEMQTRFPSGFQLEVTSPGVTYPLSELYQFRRNLQRSLQVFHNDPDVPNPVEGVLRRVEDDQITVESRKGVYVLSLSAVEKGKLLLNW